MLTDAQYQILERMNNGDFDTYYSYDYWVEKGRPLPVVKKIIGELKAMGLVEYRKGLMNEEGEVAGSGHGIPYGKNHEVTTLIEEYEKANGINQ